MLYGSRSILAHVSALLVATLVRVAVAYVLLAGLIGTIVSGAFPSGPWPAPVAGIGSYAASVAGALDAIVPAMRGQHLEIRSVLDGPHSVDLRPPRQQGAVAMPRILVIDR